MANAFSIPAQYNEYIDPIDMRQVETTLAVKDAKYQANVVKIESQIEAMGNVPLLRDKDKQMLADNMKTITSQINQMSKMQLSRGTASLETGKAIKSAVTPYLADQMALARGFQEDQKMINEKRQKHPELYSDVNYTDALEQSGINAYMAGETDSFSRLQYSDAYDMGKLDEKVQKWAKDFGRTTSFDSQTQGGITTITKFQDLSASDIQAFIEHSITADPQLARQLQINSRQNYKGLSDEQFKSEYLSVIKSNVENNSAHIKSLRTQLGNYSEGSQERKYLQSQIEVYENRNSEYQKEVDGRIPFNRQSAQAKSYMTDFIGGYVNTYAKRSIIDVDQNTYAFDIAYKQEDLNLKKQKFAFEVEKDLREQKAEALAGLPFETPSPLQDKDASVFAQKEASYKSAKLEVSNALMSDPEYASANAQDREAIYQASLKNSDSLDVTSGKYSAETIQKLQKAKAEKEALDKYGISVANYWKPRFEELYNGIAGGVNKDLNINNLAITMPFTANLIKSGKTDMTKLTTQQKEAVYAEMSENMRDNLAGSDKDILDQLNIVSKGYRSRLPKGFLPEQRKVENQLGTVLGSSGALLGNVLESAIISPFIGLTQGRGAMNKFREENQKEYNRIRNEGDRAFYTTALSGVMPYVSDADLGSLQERDVNLSGSKGVKAWFDSATQGAKDLRELRDLQVGTSVNRGVSFANIGKEDKVYTNTISQLAASKNIKVDPKSQFSYYKQGNDYVFKVDEIKSTVNEKGTGNNKVIQQREFIVPEYQVPELLRGRVTEQTPFVEGKTNFRYKVPQDSDSRNTSIVNLVNASGISDSNLINATNNSLLTFEQIAQPYERDIRPEHKEWYNFLKNAEFQTKVVKTVTGGYKSFLQIKKSDGGWQSLTVESPEVGRYDSSLFISGAPMLAQEYLTQQFKLMTRR